MSRRAVTWVDDESQARLGARLIMLALADQANDDGFCYQAVKRLLRRSGLKSVSSIHTNVKHLERVLHELHRIPVKVAFRRVLDATLYDPRTEIVTQENLPSFYLLRMHRSLSQFDAAAEIVRSLVAQGNLKPGDPTPDLRVPPTPDSGVPPTPDSGVGYPEIRGTPYPENRGTLTPDSALPLLKDHVLELGSELEQENPDLNSPAPKPFSVLLAAVKAGSIRAFKKHDIEYRATWSSARQAIHLQHLVSGQELYARSLEDLAGMEPVL